MPDEMKEWGGIGKLERPVLVQIRSEIDRLAALPELAIKETVAQRDLEVKLSFLQTWDSIRNVFRRGKEGMERVSTAGEESVEAVVKGASESISDFWRNMETSRQEAKAEQEQIWKMRMEDY